MELKLYSQTLADYLACDETINYEHDEIRQVSEQLMAISKDEIEFTKRAYEYVRDNFPHSADIQNDQITCSALDVMHAGHGICFTKSHLLAALLRSQGIPTGLCYQKLILDDETAPYLVLHGLVAVYLKTLDKWIRLDARGNKEGVDAQFSIDEEKLAFPVRPEMQEEDILVVYPKTDANVLRMLQKYKTRSQMWQDIPSEVALVIK